MTCCNGRVHPSRRGLPARLLLTLLIGTASVLIGGSAATAADPPSVPCPFISLADSAERAAAVFTGEVTSSTRLEKPSDERGAYFIAEVEVTSVYRGRIESTMVEVRTETTPRECSLGELVLDTPYVFFVSSGDPYIAQSDGGTRVADAEVVLKLERLLGQGRDPVPPEPEKAEFTPVATSEPPTLSRAVAPGLAVALLGVLGLVLMRGISRRR